MNCHLFTSKNNLQAIEFDGIKIQADSMVAFAQGNFPTTTYDNGYSIEAKDQETLERFLIKLDESYTAFMPYEEHVVIWYNTDNKIVETYYPYSVVKLIDYSTPIQGRIILIKQED
jgi:hypothetical protein